MANNEIVVKISAEGVDEVVASLRRIRQEADEASAAVNRARGGGAMRNPNIGVIVFSLIETVTNAVALILWLQQIDGGLFTENKVQAYVVWIVGFIIEHIVAFNVSKQRPWFSFPLRP